MLSTFGLRVCNISYQNQPETLRIHRIWRTLSATWVLRDCRPKVIQRRKIWWIFAIFWIQYYDRPKLEKAEVGGYHWRVWASDWPGGIYIYNLYGRNHTIYIHLCGRNANNSRSLAPPRDGYSLSYRSADGHCGFFVSHWDMQKWTKGTNRLSTRAEKMKTDRLFANAPLLCY